MLSWGESTTPQITSLTWNYLQFGGEVRASKNNAESWKMVKLWDTRTEEEGEKREIEVWHARIEASADPTKSFGVWMSLHNCFKSRKGDGSLCSTLINQSLKTSYLLKQRINPGQNNSPYAKGSTIHFQPWGHMKATVLEVGSGQSTPTMLNWSWSNWTA